MVTRCAMLGSRRGNSHTRTSAALPALLLPPPDPRQHGRVVGARQHVVRLAKRLELFVPLWIELDADRGDLPELVAEAFGYLEDIAQEVPRRDPAPVVLELPRPHALFA